MPERRSRSMGSIRIRRTMMLRGLRSFPLLSLCRSSGLHLKLLYRRMRLPLPCLPAPFIVAAHLLLPKKTLSF